MYTVGIIKTEATQLIGLRRYIMKAEITRIIYLRSLIPLPIYYMFSFDVHVGFIILSSETPRFNIL